MLARGPTGGLNSAPTLSRHGSLSDSFSFYCFFNVGIYIKHLSKWFIIIFLKLLISKCALYLNYISTKHLYTHLLHAYILVYRIEFFFLIKTGCSPIDFDKIFPMQSSEFTKSLYFWSNSEKKTLKNILKLFIFSPENRFV